MLDYKSKRKENKLNLLSDLSGVLAGRFPVPGVIKPILSNPGVISCLTQCLVLKAILDYPVEGCFVTP